MITYLQDVYTAQNRVVSFLYFNPGVKWVHDFANEKLFSDIHKRYFNTLKTFNPEAFAKLYIERSLPLDFCTPAMCVSAIQFLYEFRLGNVFYVFLKKQDQKISDFDSIILRDSIEFLELNEEGINILDKCKYILSQIKLKASRIDTADLEFYLNMFDEKLKEIATKMQYTDKVEAFLNCNFEVANKNFTKLEAAKNITRMAYMQNPDPNYLAKWVCDIAELPEKKLLKILEIIKE